MPVQKTFVLGCGAQKAGTTWLHDHLARNPAADFGAVKEYHVFDALELPELAHVLERRDPSLLHRPKAYLRYLLHNRRLPRDEALRRRLRDPEAYVAYFADLAARDGITLTGDITPEYAGLSDRTLADIRSRFARRGLRTRALFLMRDPVERCLSAIRMYRGRDAALHKLDIGKADATEATVVQIMSHGRFEIATRYDVTLTRLEAAFGADLCTGFYEELFQPDEVARIETFLGLAPLPPDLGAFKNESGFKDETVSDATRAAVARHFAPVYADAERRFGRARMHALWPGYAALA
jgi:hypothetical protein